MSFQLMQKTNVGTIRLDKRYLTHDDAAEAAKNRSEIANRNGATATFTVVPAIPEPYSGFSHRSMRRK